MKKEAGIAERKLLARNERIQNLETLLQDADRRLAVQNQKFEAQLQQVKERLDQARGMRPNVLKYVRMLKSVHFSTKGCRVFAAQLRTYCETVTGRRWSCTDQSPVFDKPDAWLKFRKSFDKIAER